MDTIKEVTMYKFIETICKDYNVDINKTDVLVLPQDRKEIKKFTRSRAEMVRIVVDNIEAPYMLDDYKRNQEALDKAQELRCSATKYLQEVIQETGVILSTKTVKISEGGGWYSHGTEYTYKNIKTEQ